MSFYKKVPGLQRTLESELLFDKEPKAGSTNPVTSEGVAEALNKSETNAVKFVFNDGSSYTTQIEYFTEEFYNSHELGNFYISDDKVFVCTEHEHSGDDYGTKLVQVHGMVEALNKLAERVTALENA